MYMTDFGSAFNTWAKLSVLQAGTESTEAGKAVMSMTEQQAIQSAIAFGKAVAAHLSWSAVVNAVAQVFTSNPVTEAAKAHWVATGLVMFTGAQQHTTDVKSVKNGKASYTKVKHTTLPVDHVLMAEFCVTADNLSTLHDEPVEQLIQGGNDLSSTALDYGQATIDGALAHVKQGYKATAAVVLAAKATALLEAEQAAVNKAGKKMAAVKKNNKGLAGYKLVFDPMSDAELVNLSHNFGKLAQAGVLYPQMMLDAKGRQYPVGWFSHLDKGVLSTLMMNPGMAEEVVTDAGLNVGPAVKAAEKILAGDATAAKYFWALESGISKNGKLKFAKASFKSAALLAAITLVAVK